MTPTLLGRWQTRTLLITVVGLPVTVLYAASTGAGPTPFFMLGHALLLGLMWDWGYQGLQSLRWNRDWPPIFGFFAGVWEGVWLYGAAQIALPFSIWPGTSLLLGIPTGLSGGPFWAHYTLVFGTTFLSSLGLLHIFIPRWRYQGGQWV